MSISVWKEEADTLVLEEDDAKAYILDRQSQADKAMEREREREREAQALKLP